MIPKNAQIRRFRWSSRTAWCGLVLLAALAAAPLSAAAADRPADSLSALTGKTVGILVGTILDQTAERHIDYVTIKFFDEYDPMEQALLAGEIDALFGDEPVMRQRAANNPRLTVLGEALDASEYAFATRPENLDLHREVTSCIGEFKRDGTLARLCAKWIAGSEEDKKFVAAANGEGDKILRLGTCPDLPPFSYYDAGGRITGMDVEMAELMARRLGYRLEIACMDFGSMIPSLVNGEVDLIGGALTVTPDRAKVVKFAEGYHRIGVVALVRNEE